MKFPPSVSMSSTCVSSVIRPLVAFRFSISSYSVHLQNLLHEIYFHGNYCVALLVPVVISFPSMNLSCSCVVQVCFVFFFVSFPSKSFIAINYLVLQIRWQFVFRRHIWRTHTSALQQSAQSTSHQNTSHQHHTVHSTAMHSHAQPYNNKNIDSITKLFLIWMHANWVRLLARTNGSTKRNNFYFNQNKHIGNHDEHVSWNLLLSLCMR